MESTRYGDRIPVRGPHGVPVQQPVLRQYNELWDTECNYICAPSGGYTGKGDQKCTDFNDKAELVKVVWKDERE